ncbi:hypothetical protein [Collinsella stercoris]|uniref:hypothetical protein n=1 Tax=Collinsella stercoris TaxID=147206 RepID=UPI003993701A
MAMTRLSDPTPRMTLPRALLSEALRLARSPLAAVHLVCGLAAGLACGEYFSVTRWDPALGADAYAQFLGALMPLMSAIVCGLAVDEERAAGRLANLTAVPSRGRAVAAKLLTLAALGAGALAVALGVFGAVLAVAGRLPLGPAPLAAAWAGIVLVFSFNKKRPEISPGIEHPDDLFLHIPFTGHGISPHMSRRARPCPTIPFWRARQRRTSRQKEERKDDRVP